MVHKTSHRGVHSGNTLRAFNSRYSRRYQHQACIVSRIHPQLLQKLLCSPEGKAESSKMAPAPPNNNVAVDVALSLNKQCRWLLPKALIKQVSSDDIGLASLTVSVLERHKLKRPASCVSYHSNSGEIRRIQPRNGRYFSFAFPTVDGKSRRAARREHREEMRAMLQQQQQKEVLGKMVEVDAKPSQDPGLELGESEIRYEVYYPSPANSSLSHNPKYIKQDVTVAPGDEGYGEHVLHGKPRRQHGGRQRRRMTLKDVDDCDLPAYSDALYYAQGFQLHDGRFDNNEYEEERSGTDAANDDETKQRAATTECLLGSLIEKAEQLQHVVGVQSKRRRKKTSSRSKQEEEEGQTTRGHIFYLSDLDKQATQAKPSRGLSEEEDGTDLLLSAVHTQQPATSRFVSEANTRVLLSREDTSVSSLKESFGPLAYFEASCRPRKFLLDITRHVRELLKKKGVDEDVADRTEDVMSFLVFVHDGILDDEYDVYKLFINSRLQKGVKALHLEDTVEGELYKGTVANLVSKAVDLLETTIEERITKNHLFDSRKITENPQAELSFLHFIKKAFSSGSSVSEVHIPSIEELLEEEPAFCDMCYTDVSSLTQDSASCTTLLGCRHRVCNWCWIRHLNTMVREESASRLTCPQHDCLQNVDVGVLLSLSWVDEAAKLLHQEERVRSGASLQEKFCPDPQCGRVLRLAAPRSSTGLSRGPDTVGAAADPELQDDVMCACGAHVCFHCLELPHWPATCPQAAQYRAALSVPGALPDRLAEVHVDDAEEEPKLLTVTGKHCPRCDRFVTKEAGGAGVECVCGQQFCWYCTKLGEGHDQRGSLCVSPEEEARLTTTVLFHHPESPTKPTKKVSLVERAAAHHQRLLRNHGYSHAVAALAKAVAAAAAKNRVVAEHVLKVCHPEGSGAGRSHNDKQQLVCSKSSPDEKSLEASLLPVVTNFVKTAVKCNQDLHEVAEYSLVLLKDVPDSVLRRRALRISDDLEAYCSFMQSVLDVWSPTPARAAGRRPQEAVRALTRLGQIQSWTRSALAAHVTTIKKIRSSYVTSCQ